MLPTQLSPLLSLPHPLSLQMSSLLVILSVLELPPSVVNPTITNLALDVPLPNTYTSFSLRGRAQVEQPADLKGKQRQPLPLQVEPACPPMEDEITPGNLYADVPMTINKPNIVQGTMFPDFNGTEFPYRVHCLGQGNDGIRSIFFMRINNNLYAYGNKMISKVIRNMNKGVPPPVPTHKQSDIHKLYAIAYEEPEDKAPCIHKAQDLVTYINLWKSCRLEMNEVMDLVLKEWRPPAWASQKAHHHQGDLPPISIRDLQSHLDHEEGPTPLEKGQEGLSPSFCRGLHPFTPQLMTGMFPGALGFSSCPDDDEAEGQYRALLEWAEVTPTIGSPAPWEGGFSCAATMADVTAYLAANGITFHNANNALKWAQRAGNKYVAQIISNRGDKDPNTKAIIDQMRAALNELLPMGEHHSLEWIDLQAHMLGVPPKSIMPYEAHLIKERDLFILREFAKSAALYDLPHCARGEGNDAGGVLLIPANTLEEGEMEDDSRLM
ncbi:hypothetical protein EDC04DRAFT_2600520 [Pisolithus marmoratus]|nr:hypothetical protein EDC04DRAFT_2600520 [Pisolithus marmoratus]